MEKQQVSTVDFVRFITRTLIPDLKHSGHYATAQDFDRAVAFIEDPSTLFFDGYGRGQFVAYLREVVIPDMRESSTRTAEDFRICADMIDEGSAVV